jgi:serine/threonine protein kinase
MENPEQTVAPPAASVGEIPASDRTTVVEERKPAPTAEMDRGALVENYRALIRERALPYPLPYRFQRELGKGRQGIVFLALRHGARGCVTRHAVKLFDPGIYSTAKTYWADMERIAGQVTLLQPMRIDNLISGDAYDECRGVGFVEMTAIDGIDVEYLLEGAHLAIARSQTGDEEWAHFEDVLFRIRAGGFKLQPGIAIYILRKVLIALSVMHAAGFLHGDIKPSNIMIDRMGSVKLVDLGRAARIGERVDILLGSPLYMAPEIQRLEPGQIQSDIYSAGLVCLEMLAGQVLDDCLEMREDQLLDFKLKLPQKLEGLLPDYVRENRLLVGILKRMLDPHPGRRFVSAEDAADNADGMRGVHRQLSRFGLDAEYDRELAQYLNRLSDPATGFINPRFDA